MSDVKQTTSNGLGLCTVLFLIFMTLKLTGNIAWSWWWVAAPIWIPWGLVISLVTLALIATGIVGLVSAIGAKRRGTKKMEAMADNLGIRTNMRGRN